MKRPTTLFTLLTLIVTFQISAAETENTQFRQRPAFSWEGKDLNTEKCNILVNEIVENEYSQVVGLTGVYTDTAGSKTFTVLMQDSFYRSGYNLDPYSSPPPRVPYTLKGRMDESAGLQIWVNDLERPIAEIIAHDSVIIKKCNQIPKSPSSVTGD